MFFCDVDAGFPGFARRLCVTITRAPRYDNLEEFTMNAALEGLIGRSIRVWSGDQGLWDEGVLEVFDPPWLRMRKSDGEILCFSACRIRLIKLLDKEPEDHHVVAV
jgi:hypothetical protein